MRSLETAIVAALATLDDEGRVVSLQATELHALVQKAEPGLDVTVGDVEEVVRHMSRDRRGVHLEYAEGSLLVLRLLPAPVTAPITTNVNVSGGSVQVGDYNQMQYNTNTFGSVLVQLRAKIERDTELSAKEKSGVLAALDKVLSSPLLGTILALAFGGGPR